MSMPPSPDRPFFLAVNYPWRNYGQDFGAADGQHRGISRPDAWQSVARDFAKIQETGATVVRWFLFGDGRGGFLREKGIARRPDEFLFKDVAAVFQLALRHGLQLCFSLIDFLWLQEHGPGRAAHGQEHVLHFAAGRAAFLENILVPLFREFRGHASLFAWEIANEPEWAIREFHRVAVAQLHFSDFRAYAAEIASAAHEYGQASVTLGSGRLLWVRAWSGLGLDYYQAHYYPAGERETGKDLAEQLRDLPPLDRPLWLGELPARDRSLPEYSLAQALQVCRSSGLSGAGVWRWTEPDVQGTDMALGRIDPAELMAWSQRERGEPGQA